MTERCLGPSPVHKRTLGKPFRRAYPRIGPGCSRVSLDGVVEVRNRRRAPVSLRPCLPPTASTESRSRCGAARQDPLSRVQLVDEMSSIDGTEQVVRAFNAVGASAPVRLGRPETDVVVEVVDRWAADVGAEQLPGGVWDLRSTIVEDLATEPG